MLFRSADLQITTLKSKRLLPSRFKVDKLTFSTHLFIVEPMPPSLQRPAHRGAGAEPCRALSPVSLAQEKPGRRRRRRGKSHGLRIRGFRKRPRMLACVRLLLLSKPKQRLRFGKWERGDGKHCRSTDNHPEKQTTIAKLIQSRQAHVPHPLVYRRTYAPFASAPWAPGCRGGAPPRSFPGFSRAREIGPPEASSGEKEHLTGEAACENGSYP